MTKKDSEKKTEKKASKDLGLTEIICIVDKSGSMMHIANDTIGGFNSFLQEQKKHPGEAKLSLTLFDTKFNVVHNGVPIQEVPELNDKTYIPGGLTALHDAVGKTIDEVIERLKNVKKKDKPKNIIVVILTDGEENSSVEYKGDQIREKTTKLQKDSGWEFIYLGANVDAIKEAKSIGVSHVSNFAATGRSIDAAYLMTSALVSNYRTRGVVNTNDLYDVDEEGKKKEKK